MPFSIIVTRDFDQMSQIAATLVENDIAAVQTARDEYVLGLATGNTPSGLYKHLAKAFNAGRIDPARVRSFNLDEYVGLPGENAEQRTLHPQSYSFFMVSELFALLSRKFAETNVPWGAVIDQDELIAALASNSDDYELRGANVGQSVSIRPEAGGYLGWIRSEILDRYAAKIEAAGGVDLQLVGVGGRGHIAFHEAGIPFETDPMLLVQLDDNTVANAVSDGHFLRKEDSPQYAVSMSAGLVFQARTVLLVANGERKTEPITESVLGPVTADVPISLGQKFVADGGYLVYVLDEAAAAGLLERRDEVAARGYNMVDVRSEEYTPVSELQFSRDPETGALT